MDIYKDISQDRQTSCPVALNLEVRVQTWRTTDTFHNIQNHHINVNEIRYAAPNCIDEQV
jgi:hypothetical protein